MVNLTLSIPEEIKNRMDAHKDIKWSNSIRILIEQKLNDFEESEKLANKLNLKENNIALILERVNQDLKKHNEALINESNNRR